MDHSRQRHHSRLLPTTIQDLFSPVPAVTVPQSLESLANTWLPKSLSYDGEGGELGALEERAQEEENASFEDEGAFYYSTKSSSTPSYAFDTPPSSPSHARSRSAASTPHATPSRSFAPTSLSTPPSESTLHVLKSTPLHPHSASPVPSDAFNPTVGSPPRRLVRDSESFSLPATPRSIALVQEEERKRRNKGPWTWPARGERARDWREVTTPTKEGAARDGEGGMMGGLADTEEWQDRKESLEPLVTRYVRVEGLSRNATEEELRELFVTRYSTLKGCFTALLRTHGVVVLCFHDARHAFNSLASLNAPPASFHPSLHAFCISRDSFDMLNSSQPNPLLSPSEAVLILTLQGPTLSPTSLLHSLGDIRSLRLVDPATFVVEYWNERQAEFAAEVMDGETMGGCRLRCSFEPSVASTGMPEVVEKVVKPEQAIYRSPGRRAQVERSAVPFGSIGNTLDARTQSYVPRSQGGKFEKPSQVDQTSPAWTPPRNSPSPSTGLARSQAGTQWGILREEQIPVANVLDLGKIEQGFDIRTTLMIKNIPNRLSQADLMAFIDETSHGVRSYDFLYLRVDFHSHCNTGYAFVNFISVDALLQFARARLGTRWNLFQSDKIVVASYGNIQGKEALINRFRSSAVMEQPLAFRPRLFYSFGPHAGQPEPFPESDDPRRKARSALNAQTHGLFPASQPVFKVTQALKGLHV